MSILGVTLVLFLLGIIGWLVINANKLGDYFKENVEVRAYLRGDLNPRVRKFTWKKKMRTGAKC